MKFSIFLISLFFLSTSVAQMSAQENGPVSPSTFDEAREQCERNSASVSESMGCIAAARDAFAKKEADSSANCDQVSNGTGHTGCMLRPEPSADQKPERPAKPDPIKCVGVSNGTGGHGCINENASGTAQDKKSKRNGAVAK